MPDGRCKNFQGDLFHRGNSTPARQFDRHYKESNYKRVEFSVFSAVVITATVVAPSMTEVKEMGGRGILRAALIVGGLVAGCGTAGLAAAQGVAHAAIK